MKRIQLSDDIVAELKAYAQILTISPEIPKPSKRFIEDALYGLLQSQSVVLSRVAQALKEPAQLLHVEQRLSYQMTNDRWDPLSAESSYLQWASQQMTAETVISVDMGDIAKKYARKMPNLGIVWDGSSKKTAPGYPLVEIEAIQPNGKHLPLYLDLLSTRKASYVSQNHQIDLAIDFLISHIGTQGIYAMDRGNDDEKRFKFMDERRLRWVIRVRGDRIVERADAPHLKPRAISAWAQSLRPLFELRLKTNGKTLDLKGALLPIRLPNQPEATYHLIVVWTQRKRPWYLMTRLPRKEAQRAVFAYVRRWGVEDAARVIKQSFDLENIRLLTFAGLRKMVWLTLWAYGFVCRIGAWPKALLKVLMSGVPALWEWEGLKIVYYRVATALSRLLAWPPPHLRSTLKNAEAIFA
jgi:hypothetical protein